MKKRLRFGLIGVGGFGGLHFNVLTRLEAENIAELAAVADPYLSHSPDCVESLEARRIPSYGGYRELLDAQLDLDAVVVATPIPLHYEMTRECLRRGLAVYLEKPPVPLIQQLEDLIAADPRGRVAVGFQMITTASIQNLKKMIAAGELGDIREFRVSACWPRVNQYYERAGWAGKMRLGREPVFDGPATNALAHLLHNVMYLAGDTAVGFGSPVEIQAELYRARPIESYDIAGVRGRFESGATFSAALSHANEETRKYRLEVRGTRGWARISEDGARFDGSAGSYDLDADIISAIRSSYLDFIRFLHGEQESPATRLEDVRGFLRATNGALISSGGIHSIAPEFRRIYGEGPASGYDVPGLGDWMEGMFAAGGLFSGTDAPWAVRTEPVDVRGLAEIDFGRYCARGDSSEIA